MVQIAYMSYDEARGCSVNVETDALVRTVNHNSESRFFVLRGSLATARKWFQFWKPKHYCGFRLFCEIDNGEYQELTLNYGSSQQDSIDAIKVYLNGVMSGRAEQERKIKQLAPVLNHIKLTKKVIDGATFKSVAEENDIAIIKLINIVHRVCKAALINYNRELPLHYRDLKEGALRANADFWAVRIAEYEREVIDGE